MQQDGTNTAIATESVAANDSFENALAVNKKVPANTSRFSFELMGSSEELRVLEFLGKESISNPFEFKVILATKNDLLTAAQFMGKSGLLTFVAHEHNELLHGDIARFRQYGQQGDFLLYQVTLVPHFWFLKHRHNHRIFQEQSVPQIIKTIFHEAGISPDHFELRLSREYSPREYCVQYAESEFDFISRLMEQHGLHYHFEHHLDKHIMVIADHNSAFPSIQNEQAIQYHPLDSLNADKDVIKQFHKKFQVHHGSVHFRDYSFKKPMDRLDNHQSAEFDTALEDYQFPGDYHSKTAELKSSGGQKTQLKLQQHQALREESELQSNCQRLRAGIRYDMFDNPNGKNNQQYLLTEVQHQAKQPQSLDEYAAGNTGSYSNEAKCIPAKTPYKTPIKHKKPTLTGYQSSTVTGPEGEEIYTNEHAQSKAQFPWDREAQQNEKSSCWIRSMQVWAGKNWGSMILPRMGQEAKTGFIHSDPDRPIITGRVYNERHQTPYALARHKTRSTFKSHSTLGGRGYNEIRFEDRKNQEQVYFHAEKNLDIRIKNNCREIINHDRHLIVDNNRYEYIKDNSYHTIDNNQNEQIGQVHSTRIGQNQHSKAGQAALTEVAQNIHFKAGQKIVLEAGVELTIKAGGGFIKIDPSGITAQGAAISLNSGTGASSATQASPTQATIAVAADKDKPGQRFKPIPPQAIKAPEKIGFKGEISRLLQAGNDKKQAICIPCILKSLAKHDVVANVLPEIINTRQKHPLDPLPLEPLEREKPKWLELKHELSFSDDQGQVTPAANISYQLDYPDGRSPQHGTLDSNGFARLDGVPSGVYQVTYEPDIDDEIKTKQSEIQKVLNSILQDERKESAGIEKKLQNARYYGLDFPGSNTLAQIELYKVALGKGLWNGMSGLANFAWELLKGGGRLMYELALRSNPITAPIKFREDLKALKSTHKELQQFADDDLELYAALISDDDTQTLFKNFSTDYLDAQHSLEYTEAGGEVSFDILLTIFTVGVGAAASIRHAGKLKKLKPLMQKLMALLKRKRAKGQFKGVQDTRINSKNKLKSDDIVSSKNNWAKKNIRTPKPSVAEIKLSKSSGNTVAHIAARNKVARNYMENNGYSSGQIIDALGSSNKLTKGGVDLNKPLEIIQFPPPEKMYQYVKSHGNPGNWFDPVGKQTADSLGVNAATRTSKAFKMPKGDGLLSRSRPIIDDWTVPEQSVQTGGGGIQLFVNDKVKNCVN